MTSLFRRVVAALAIVGVVAGLVVVVPATETAAIPVAPGTVLNPLLPAQCGIKVMLVVDSSGSIDLNGTQVTGAVGTFLDVLIDTGSQVGVVDFDTQVNQTIAYTPVTPATRAGVFQTYINSYDVGGGTNWAAALNTANVEPDGNDRPDLVLFLTDGRPTYRGGYTPPGGTFITRTDDGDGSNTSSQERIEAANRADQIKTEGTHIFLVGVGNALGSPSGGDRQSIEAVTGDIQYPTETTQIGNADYSLISQFTQLANAFRELVFALCDTSVTITKLVDSNNDGTGEPAANYPFAGTVATVNGTAGTSFVWKQPAVGQVTAPNTQTVSTTGAAGTASFQWTPGTVATPQPWSSTFSFTEPPTAGSVFVSATCTVKPPTGTPVTAPYTLGSPITVPRGAIVSCTVLNRRVATITLRKQWGVSTSGDAAAMSMSAPGIGPAAATAISNGTPRVDPVFATLAVPVGATLSLQEILTFGTGPFSTSLDCNGQPVTVNRTPPAGTSPLTVTGSIVVPNVPSFNCTFLNTRQTQLILSKTWGLGAIPGNAVNLTAAVPGRSASGSSVAGGAGTSATLTVNTGETATLTEAFTTGAAGNYAKSLACTGNTGPLSYTPNALTGSLPIVATDQGNTIRCVFTNIGPAAQVVVGKELDPPLDPGRFNLQVNGTTVVPNAGDGARSAPVAVQVGQTVTVAELAGTDTALINYTTSLACDNGVTPGAGGSFMVPASARGLTITCVFTNTRKQARILVTKDWIGPAVPGQSVIVGAATDQGIEGMRVFNDGSPPPPPVAIAVSVGDTVRLGEQFLPGQLDNFVVGLQCNGVNVPLQAPVSDPDNSVPPTLREVFPGGLDILGNLLVPPAAATTDIVCIFTNTRTSATLTLQKTWANGAVGDTAALTIDGLNDGSAIAVSPAGNGTSPQTASATVFGGEAVNLAEAFGANVGAYGASLACNVAGLTYTAGQLTGTFTMPIVPVPVTCTFTNTRTSTTLVLRKTWGPNSAAGDTATLTVDGTDDAPPVTATAPATAATVAVTVFSGEDVNLAEAFGTNVGSYSPALTCDQNGLAYTPGATAGTYKVPAAPAPVTCTFTNTRQSATLTLQKTWINGAANDTAVLTVDGSTDGTAIAVSPGGTAPSPQQVIVSVLSGETVSLTETFGTNVGTYTPSLTCNQPGLTYAGGTTGTFTVPAAPTPVTCTFANTRVSATLTLQKTWTLAVAGDSVTLALDGSTDGSIVAVAPGGTAQSPETVTIPVLSGETVTLSETFGANTGSYGVNLTCNRLQGLTYTPGATSGTFAVGGNALPVICTFTNSRVFTTLVLEKTWVNGAAGDTATLSVDGINDESAPATAPDPAATAEVVVFTGEAVNLAEAFGTNVGSYTPALECDRPGLAYTAGAITGVYTVPDAPQPVTCTFTNTRTSTTLVLEKTWGANSAADDTAELTVEGLSDAAPVTATAPSPAATTAVEVFSGEAVTLTEAFGINVGTYTPSLVCDQDGLVYTAGTTTGVYTVPNTTAPVTCTFTNTRVSTTLVLQKNWAANSAAGDTAELTVDGINDATPVTATAPAPAATAAVIVFSGEEVDLEEVFGTANVGTYTAALVCSQDGLDYVDGATTGVYTVQATAAPVTCTFTNTRVSTTLILEKTWAANSAAGDTTELTVDGTNDATPVTATAPNVAVTAAVTVFTGEEVNLAEVFGASNVGAYAPELACDQDGLEYIAGATTGVYTVPDVPQPVTCTFTNRRVSTMLILEKTWVNSATGDTAVLTVDGLSDAAPATATAPSPAATTAVEVFSGEAVTLTETFGINVGTYTPALECDQDGLVYTAGTTTGVYTVPDAPAPVICTFTNTRQSATLTLQKTWTTAVAGDSVTLALDGTTDGSIVAVAPGGTAQSPQTVTIPVLSGETVTLSETFGANTGSYGAGLTCNRLGLTYSPGATSGTFEVRGAPVPVTCTFSNTRLFTTLILEKTWVNGAVGDTAELTVDGINSESATATAPDPAATAEMVVYSGEAVNLSEVFGANVGAYTPELECDQDGLAYTAEALTGIYTVPLVPLPVTCTFTNTRTSTTLILEKTWGANSAAGDTAVLTVDGTNDAAPVTATAPNSAATAGVLVFSGEEVDLAEVFGTGNVGSYTPELECDQDGLAYAAGATTGIYTVPDAPQPVTCTFTNRRVSTTLVLAKTWAANSAAGDTSVLTVDGLSDAAPVTATAPEPAATGAVTVFSGEEVDLDEVFGTGNVGTYTPALACDQDGLDYTADETTGTYTVPDAPVPVTCTFTNTRVSTTLVLEKTWAENSAAGDTAVLTVDGLSDAAPVTATAPEPAATAAVTVFSGEEVDLAEVFGTGNVGSYTPELECDQVGLAYAAEATTGVYTVPDAPQPVTCTFTNTRTSTTLILAKTWGANSADGDTAELTVDGVNDATPVTSAAPEPAATTAVEVFSGEAVTLTETFGTNVGSYTPALECDADGLVYAAGTTTGLYTVQPAPVPVTCTFTNTRVSTTLVLEKIWVNGADGDTAELMVDGINDAAPVTSTAPEPAATAAVEVFSGEEVDLEEALGTGNVGSYTPALECDQDGLEYTAGETTGTYAVPDAPVPVTCTFTNTRVSTTLVLEKTWAANSAAGDTAELTVAGTNQSTVTSTAPADAATTAAEVFSGEDVTLTEAFGPANAGSYAPSLTCDQPGLEYTVGDATGTYTVPAAPAAAVVTCTFTNRVGELTVTKQVTGVADDVEWSFAIALDPGFEPQTVTGTGNTSASVTFGPLVPDTEYTLSEVPGEGFTPGPIECIVTHPDATTETFEATFPAGPGDVVACIVPNDALEDPTITKTVVSGPTSNPDGTYTLAYDIVVTNGGLGPTEYDLTDVFAFAEGVVVTDVVVVNIVPGDIDVNENFDGAADTAIASGVPFDAGESHTYRVTVTADVSAVITVELLDCELQPGEEGTGFLNRATVNPTAEDCAPIPGPADLQVTKDVDLSTIMVDPSGQTQPRLTYTIVVTNLGPATAVDVSVVDNLPPGVTVETVTPSVGSCTTSATQVSCALGSMVLDATAELEVTVELESQNTGSLTNQVEVTSTTPDPDPSNNEDQVATSVKKANTLPQTGRELVDILGIAVILLAAGLFLIAAGRGLRRARPPA